MRRPKRRKNPLHSGVLYNFLLGTRNSRPAVIPYQDVADGDLHPGQAVEPVTVANSSLALEAVRLN